jgi:hypothetical protein
MKGVHTMTTETLNRLEEVPQASDSGRTESRNKTLRLLANLETEFITFVAAESALFESVSRIRERCLGEAGRDKKDSESLMPALRDLKWSIKHVESSHQRLMTLLNEICTVLSSMGV